MTGRTSGHVEQDHALVESAVVEVPRLHFQGGPLADRYRSLDRGVDVMALPGELTIEGFAGGRYVKSMVSWGSQLTGDETTVEYA